MSNDNKSKLLEIEIDLSQVDELNSFVSELVKLSKKGYKRVNLTVQGSVKDRLYFEEIDESAFTKIVELQELPEWVVLDLIKSQGSITDFQNSDRFNEFG